MPGFDTIDRSAFRGLPRLNACASDTVTLGWGAKPDFSYLDQQNIRLVNRLFADFTGQSAGIKSTMYMMELLGRKAVRYRHFANYGNNLHVIFNVKRVNENKCLTELLRPSCRLNELCRHTLNRQSWSILSKKTFKLTGFCRTWCQRLVSRGTN